MRRPLSLLRALTHRFCFLRSPLVRAGHERPAFAGLAAALECRSLRVFAAQLQDLAHDGELLPTLLGSDALCTLAYSGCGSPALRRGRPIHSAASVIGEYRGKLNKLRKRGELRFETLTGEQASFRTRLSDFLDLEHRSWKGRNGTSMKTPGFRADYFDAAIVAPATARLLTLESLLVDDRPIAIQLNLTERRTRPMHFGFKTTFDERFARFSPGALLLQEQRNRFHEDGVAECFDSCTERRNDAVNRIWPDEIGRVRCIAAPVSLSRRASFVALRPWLTRDAPNATPHRRPSRNAVGVTSVPTVH